MAGDMPMLAARTKRARPTKATELRMTADFFLPRAVGTGVLAAIMGEERLKPLREALGLDEHSKVLLISTEGDTDRENYKKILQMV